MNTTSQPNQTSGERTHKAFGKKERSLRFLAHNAVLSKHGIFSSISDSLTTNSVMFLFQIISFLTTWAGSSFLLSSLTRLDVLPAAIEKAGVLLPLICALGVQIILFTFSSRLRRRFSPLLLIVLLLAWGVSTYTSYIGIYKVVESPAATMQYQYERANEQLAGQAMSAGSEAAKTLTQELAQVSGCVADLFSAAWQIKENANAAVENCEVPNSLKKPISGRGDEVTRETIEYINNLSKIYTQALDSSARNYGFADSEEMKKQVNEADQTLSQIRSAILNLSCVEPGTSLDTIEAMSAALQEFRNGWPATAATLENNLFYQDYYSLTALPGARYSENLDFSELLSRLTLSEAVSANGRNLLPSYNQVLNGIIQANTDISDRDLFQAVTLLNQEIGVAAEKLGDSNLAGGLLIPNLFVMPALALAAGEQNAIPCLIVAAFFDFVTILLGLVTARRKQNPLGVPYVSDASKVSVEILEDTIIAAAKTQISTSLDSPTEYAVEAVALLCNFFRYFKNKVTYAGDDNYVFYADYEALPPNQYDLVLNVLFRFNYAKLVPETIFLKLTTPLNRPVRDEPSDKQYILLRSNVAFWFSKLYSELISAGYLIQQTDEAINTAAEDNISIVS